MPSQANWLSWVPVASQSVATLEEQEAALGMQLTHPRPSLHSVSHAMTFENPPCPSQTLATFPSQTVWL